MQGDEKHRNQAQQGQCPSVQFSDPWLSNTPRQTIFKNSIFLPAGYDTLTEAESSLLALL